MPPFVRAALEPELSAVAELLREYMHETYAATWHGSEAALLRDVADERCNVLVAGAGAEIVGFLAWTPSYDLHHCVTGGEVIDLYVVPWERGRGIAPALLCAAAEAIRAGGGTYLKGTAVPTGAGSRLYGRIAVCHAEAACIVGGRAAAPGVAGWAAAARDPARVAGPGMESPGVRSASAVS